MIIFLHNKNLYTELRSRLGQDFSITGGNDVDVAALGFLITQAAL